MPYENPVGVFLAGIQAVNAEDWTGLARLCDPVSLRNFHRQLIERFAPANPPPELTIDDIRRGRPEMSMEAAEYELAAHRRTMDMTRDLRNALPSVESVDALRALAPVDAFAAWLDAHSEYRQLERLVAAGRAPAIVLERPRGRMRPTFQYIPLGAVNDGDQVAYVLYRHGLPAGRWRAEVEASIAGRPAEEQAFELDMAGRGFPQIETCRRQADGSWALLATHHILGIAGSFISEVTVVNPEQGDGQAGATAP